ncbi:MAG TPA: hypothetical protein VG125_23860 [Pirellulales bacterium]|jgi:hypothetical protein|nr:hypothetical protein [Pirellulales bacterium]
MIRVGKSRYHQFSLRALFVIVTLLCVCLGKTVTGAQRQRDAVARLKALPTEIYVWYDYQTSGLNWDKAPAMGNPFKPPPRPEWLSRSLGIDFLATVTFVDFTWSARLNRSEIAILRDLPTIQYLYLGDVNLSSSVTDTLKCLPKLRLLTVYPDVTEEDLTRLRRELPNCRVIRDPL